MSLSLPTIRLSVALTLAALTLAGCSDAGFSGSGKGQPGKGPRPQAAAGESQKPQGVSPDAPAAGAEGLGSGDFDERLQREGAKTGEIQVSLLWNNINDLDLHIVTPAGEHIFYGASQDSSGGFLDVDMNAGDAHSQKPVENVFWADGAAPRGVYKIYVHHYENRGVDPTTSFRVRLKAGSQVTTHNGSAAFSGRIGSGSGGGSTGGSGGMSNEGDEDAWLADGAGSGAVPADAVLVHSFTY